MQKKFALRARAQRLSADQARRKILNYGGAGISFIYIIQQIT